MSMYLFGVWSDVRRQHMILMTVLVCMTTQAKLHELRP